MTPRDAAPHPDVKLAASLARDLDRAFERVVMLYEDRLFRFATRFAGNALDGQEIAQDAFVRAYRALKTYDTGRIRSLALGPWLYRITLNTARNRVRGKRLASAPLDAAPERAIDRQEEPDRRTLAHETARELAAHIAALPLRYRAAVVLRYIEDLPYADISAALEVPIGTLKANVHRGMAMLRERVKAAEGVCV